MSNPVGDNRVYRAAWLCLLLALLPVRLLALELSGDQTQGGLLRGNVTPGSQVTLDGELIRTTDTGRFIVGFDRDAPAQVVLRVEQPDGHVIKRQLEIRQRDYDIQRIDGLPDKKVSPPEATLKRIRRESEQLEAARAEARQNESLYLDEGLSWPLTGRITGVYGSQRILNGKPRRPHYGLDIAADKGTPIKAPAAGVVAFTHPGMYFNGATVVLDHGLGLTSTYIHLSDIAVAQGEWVDRGQVIGQVGTTGRTTGPHLHWGLSWMDTHLDPRLLLGEMPNDGR